jgi:hypothetical protein
VAYASRSGRARTSAKNPAAFGVCQRCGIWYNRVALQFQWEWYGASLRNTFILVCKECLDIPQEQNRAITLPADPVPIFYPSVEQFAQDESDYRAVSAPPVIDPTTGLPIPQNNLRITMDSQNRVTEPYGEPVGDDQNAVMPYNGATQQAFAIPLAVLSVTSDGSATVTVTCSAVHGLQTNSQVSVQGLNFSAACGIYTAVPTTATAFTYMTYGANPNGSLLTSTTLILTALMGLP